MASATVEVGPRLIAFLLPSIVESVRVARFHIRASLSFHSLGQYADDAAVITSELVTNAIKHVYCDGTETIGVTLARAWDSEAVIVAVSDSSPQGPVMREAPPGGEGGFGLRIVESLSVHWGWRPEPGGKVVYAILAGETGA